MQSLTLQFVAGSGVRQGSSLSPAISNVFINILILQLKKLNIGCRVSGMFVGCLLYADDNILLCPSVTGLDVGHVLCSCMFCVSSVQCS